MNDVVSAANAKTVKKFETVAQNTCEVLRMALASKRSMPDVALPGVNKINVTCDDLELCKAHHSAVLLCCSLTSLCLSACPLVYLVCLSVDVPVPGLTCLVLSSNHLPGHSLSYCLVSEVNASPLPVAPLEHPETFAFCFAETICSGEGSRHIDGLDSMTSWAQSSPSHTKSSFCSSLISPLFCAS